MKPRMFLNICLAISLLVSIFNPLQVSVVHTGGVIYYHVRPVSEGLGDCSSWDNACDLNTAFELLAKQALPGEFHYVYLSEGTYIPTPGSDPRAATFTFTDIPEVNVTFEGGYSAKGDYTQDWLVYKTTFDGDLAQDDVGMSNMGENSYHVVTVTNATSLTTIKGLHIRGGNADLRGNDAGGGLMAINAAPALRNIVFFENQAYFGGGVYVSGAPTQGGSLSLMDSTFRGNVAVQNGGGLMVVHHMPQLQNLEFLGNQANQGGGAYLVGMTTQSFNPPDQTHLTFTKNVATLNGGGLMSDSSALALQGCIFAGNIAEKGEGGGAYLVDMLPAGSSPYYHAPYMSNLTFAYNEAGANGGGLWVQNSPLALDSSLFESNRAGNGAGAYLNAILATNYYTSNYPPFLGYLTFTNNVATFNGGGLLAQNGPLSLTNSTFQGNQADQGAGAYMSGLTATTYNPPSLGSLTFTNNTAASNGGGLFAQNGALSLSGAAFDTNQANQGGGAYLDFSASRNDISPVLADVTFTKNVAFANGGGLYSLYGLDLNRATFLSNRADGYGGGVYLKWFYEQLSATQMANAVFNGNVARQSGGGLYFVDGGWFYIYNSTFVNNVAAPNPQSPSTGGGIANDTPMSTLYLYNSILWNNRAQLSPQVYNVVVPSSGPAYTYHYNNLIQDAWSGSVWDSSLGLDEGGNLDAKDPGFNDFDGQDGKFATTDDDLTLSPGSPARNGAAWTGYPSQLGNDRDGNARPTSGVIDLGAYQSPQIVYVNQAATGANDGTSWKDAYTSLANTLIVLGSYYQPVSVWVAAGVYRPAIDPNDPDPRVASFRIPYYVSLYGGFAGDETSLNQRNWLQNQTILDGDLNTDDVGFTNNGENSYHVVTLYDSIMLDGFIIRGGNANHPTDTQARKGGGLYYENYASLPMLKNMLFRENYAVNGGGLAVVYSPGGGYASEAGVAAAGLVASFGNITFQNNHAYQGGGIWTDYYVILDRGGFYNNQAVFGGGIYSLGSLEIYNSLFSGNTASDSGGAIFQDAPNAVMIKNATFSGNASTNGGAGSFLQGTTEIKNSILWGNQSTQGAAVQINPDPAVGSVTYYNSLVQQSGGSSDAWNSAVGNDGGGNLDIDPLFGDPSLRLTAASPAVDRGEDAYLSPMAMRDYAGFPRVLGGHVDMGAYEAIRSNTAWPTAALAMQAPTPALANAALETVSLSQYLNMPGQSRWFKVPIEPDSRLSVSLTGLPENYDLSIYKNIPDAYRSVLTEEDVTELDAEFAPDMFSPDMFSPDMFSPDMFSPDMFSPDMFSPDMFSPDMFSPDMFSPDMFSPDMFSPDMFSPDLTREEVLNAFSSAQLRSLVGISAQEGTANENLSVNTWNNTGSYYIRVSGRNGIYDAEQPFQLEITRQTGQCAEITANTGLTGLSAHAGSYETLVLTDWARMAAQNPDSTSAAFREKVALFAGSVSGVVVDVGLDANITALNAQADTSYACPYAKNLVAYAIRDLVQAYRAQNAGLKYIVLLGNDAILPFFRHPDFATLGSEANYVPPVKNETASQASLKSNYFLSQDDYGARRELTFKTDVIPVPDLAVGRLVETPAEISNMLDAFAQGGGALASPQTALVTGYDFLADAANAVKAELILGLGPGGVVNELISARGLAPSESWTADDLKTALFTSRHDVIYLAGHFSAGGTLAADNATRVTAKELDAAGVDLKNSLVYSAGCHSGYNLVNEHGFPSVSPEPDWAQAFARKGATLVAGTGYQYGDTDFVEYSERLYHGFTRYLRAGTGPVSVGQALVWAKQEYLQNTAELRGIHVKALLESVLFGLPMVTIDMPGQRYTPPVANTIAPTPTPYLVNPGVALGLRYADIGVNTPSALKTVNLQDASQPPVIYQASYLEGQAGMKINPFEPVMPLQSANVSDPENLGNLRGVGFRGGVYADQPGILPLTGAAATEIRGVHVPFFSDVFYPIRPWAVNYFGDLTQTGDETLTKEAWLAITPAQYRSSSSNSTTGTLRTYSHIDFRAFYSSEVNQNAIDGIMPGLASPPEINQVRSSAAGQVVSFEVEVLGDPSAGIQEVWVTYTAQSGSLYGSWQSWDLEQAMDDTRLWRGSLTLPGDVLPGDMRFVVQAVSGVGKVTLSTNMGAYYIPGVDPGASPSPDQLSTALTLTGPASSAYGTEVSLTAILVDADGQPVDGETVVFELGSQQRSAITGPTAEDPSRPHGQASASLLVLGAVGENHVQVSFKGSSTLAYSSTENPFEILKQETEILLVEGLDGQFMATLQDVSGRPLSSQALFVVSQTTTLHLLTDYSGQTRFAAPEGSFTVYFNGQVPVNGQVLVLEDERYYPASLSYGPTTFPVYLPLSLNH